MVANAGPVTAPQTLRRAATARTPCMHCGQVVPASTSATDAAFCCHGCETAYAVIRSCGLERYYELRQNLGDSTPALTSDRTYADFDEPTFRSLYTRSSGGVSRCDLFLHGVHCAACLWLIERLPRMVPGLIEARLDLRRSIVRLSWDDSVVALSRIAATLASIGYPPQPARDRKAREGRVREDRRQLVRLATAGAIAGNVMLFAAALYAGMFDAMDPAHRQFFRWSSMILTLVALAWPGRVFFTSAWAAIRTRTPHIDVPIALALLAGGAWSVFTTVKGEGEIYFDTVSVLVFALLAGRFFQSRQQRSSADEVELLFSLTPSRARLVDDAGVRDVPIEALTPGVMVEVRAGDSVPCDGIIVEGDSHVDQSLLSGESRPVRAGRGERVAAGSVNLSSVLRVRVESTGEETRVGRLMRLVGEGASRRAPIVRFADRAGHWFTLGMLLLAALTLCVWLAIEPSHAVDHAVALLVVTCPCALGLATPIVLTLATGRAARRQMLIRGGDTLQSLSTPGIMVLDKTGTLTHGRLTLVEWIGPPAIRPLIAALESGSTHPIARALARDLAEPDAPRTPRVDHLEQTTGAGIRGLVDGVNLVVGSVSFVRGLADDPHALVERAGAFAADGLTPVLAAINGTVVAVAALGDTVREETGSTLAALRSRGWTLLIASGDDERVVRHVGQSLGFLAGECLAGQSPEQKLALVEGLKSRGKVVMVGDGVNDAAALAAADVGIAVHAGAEASLAASDVYLARPGIATILELLDGCERSMIVIRRNLWVSLFYNVTAAGLAVAGMINPLLAAVVMPISSLTALGVSLRSRTFGDRP